MKREAGSTTAQPMRVVLYARVSTKDQEKEGFSIPAQLRLLRDYATNKGFVIAQEFTDVETAKASGRTNFNEMLLYLRKHKTVCRTILVEKTDRLYRNIKDYATVDEFDVEVREGTKFIGAYPASGYSVAYAIDFPSPIGAQSIEVDLAAGDYACCIAPARTFGFKEDEQNLRNMGLIRGVSETSAIILTRERVVNGPLRFADEFVRYLAHHQLLPA